MFDTLMQCILNQQDETIRAILVEKVVAFITTKEQSDLSLSWIKQGYYHPAGQPDNKLQAL